MIGGSIWCLASLVEMRCTTSCLDSNTCCSGPYFACCFCGHVGAYCKGQSRDFHFAGYFAFTVVNWMARCCCHSSTVRCTSAQLMSGCLCRAAAPTHGAWRHPLHGAVVGGDRRRRWRRRRWRRQRRVRWQRRRATATRRQCDGAAAIAAVAATAATTMGTVVAATVGGGVVGAACRCGLRWAWRTAHGATWRCDLESCTPLKICALRMLENQLKSLLRAIFSPPAAPAAGS